MPTERGFVETLGVGRAGLVEAQVLHGDGSTAVYTLDDLDADPERFNERLSKLGILRDAMDRAEPVEIEYAHEDGPRPIDSVKRLTRDALERPGTTAVASGMVVGLAAATEVNIGPRGEASDRAILSILTASGPETYVIPMQTPERGTAHAMVDIARDAQASGAGIAVTYDTKTRWVTQVARSDLGGLGGGAQTEQFSAFVEEITHAPVSNLMLVSVTTAPEFQTDGNVVPLIAFTPELRHLAVVYNSPEYLLLEAALRDRLRVEIFALNPRSPNDPVDDTGKDDAGRDAVELDADAVAALKDAALSEIRRASVEEAEAIATTASVRAVAASRLPAASLLVRGATLQHALCSASRPVWIEINRRALDVGPDEECIEGLPSNDMRPQSIRELNLPYRAAWVGEGCFNPGVYRFQIATDRDITVLVDGEEICLHTDADGTTVFGHACLDGHHEVHVIFENWQCRAKFGMDVYRIR